MRKFIYYKPLYFLILFQTIQAVSISFFFASLFYMFGRSMRKVFWPVGMILTGFFGRAILFIVWIFSLLLCLLAAFWLYIAKLHRNVDNSSIEGDPNYCAPLVWFTAQIAVALFAIFSVMTAAATAAEFYYFLQGPQLYYQAVIQVPFQP